MGKPLFEDSFKWGEDLIFQNWYLPEEVTVEKYGIARLYILKGDEMLLVEKNDNTFQIPGGKIEEGEEPEDAAIREVLEEVNAIVDQKGLETICILESFKESNNQKRSYEKHFVIPSTFVEFKEFELDPAGKIVGNKFVKLAELDDYLKWGKKAEFLSKFLLTHIDESKTQY